MDKQEALDIMQSDFKLWERAASEELGGGVVAKTITLPWGIGELTTNMEGMTNATKRREAVAAYGKYIRGVIDERINDDAITSRAQVKAAGTEQTDSGHGDDVSSVLGIYNPTVQTSLDEEAKGPHESTTERTISFGDDLAAQRTEVNGRIDRHTAELARLCRQLRGIDAAIKAMEEDDE